MLYYAKRHTKRRLLLWRGVLSSALFLLWLPGACKPKHSPPFAAPPALASPQGVASMSSLKLSVNLESQEVLVGATLVVRVVLTNGGTSVVDAPDTISPSEFEFILRPADGTGTPRRLSARAASAVRNPDPLPPPPRLVQPLAPGAQREYVENLTNYALPPLPPGRYLLSVLMDNLPSESAPVPLAIVAPRVGALAIVTATNLKSLGLTFTHQQANGAVDFYQQDNRPNRPDDGVAFRRFGHAPPLTINGVAVAFDLEGSRRGRWFGWVQGEAVGGGVGQEQVTFARHEPVPLGLRAPTLQSVGWQPAIETGHFAVLGTDAQNRTAFAEVTFEVIKGGTIKTVPLAVTVRPTHWAAQYRAPESDRRYEVVTASNNGATTRVQRQTVVASKGVAEAPQLLIERNAPVVAFAFDPVGGTEPGVVDVLFGPVGENGQMTLLRLPLDGKAPLGEWKFNAPPDPNKQRPTAWAIASTPLPNPAILAKLGDKLLVCRAAGGGTWQTLVENAAQTGNLHLVVVQGQTWMIWTDPLTGVNYKLLAVP